MNRIELTLELTYEIAQPGADFVFKIHAAQTPYQVLSQESLLLSQALDSTLYTDPSTGTRLLRLSAFPGDLKVTYAVTVDLTHHSLDPALIEEVPIRHIPSDVLPYICPSRYCQSDRLTKLAHKEFGHLRQGYARVQAIRDWVIAHVIFKSNTSNASTSAIETLLDGVGVCRDFTHLMIALCRALNIPARFATGTDYGSDPALGPPDFQAYVEVYLGDRWYIFDASGTAMPMGFVRFATGRDAADVAFATIYGNVASHAARVSAVALQDASRGIELPQHVMLALSTDSGMAIG